MTVCEESASGGLRKLRVRCQPEAFWHWGADLINAISACTGLRKAVPNGRRRDVRARRADLMGAALLRRRLHRLWRGDHFARRPDHLLGSGRGDGAPDSAHPILFRGGQRRSVITAPATFGASSVSARLDIRGRSRYTCDWDPRCLCDGRSSSTRFNGTWLLGRRAGCFTSDRAVSCARHCRRPVRRPGPTACCVGASRWRAELSDARRGSTAPLDPRPRPVCGAEARLR